MVYIRLYDGREMSVERRRIKVYGNGMLYYGAYRIKAIIYTWED